MFHLRCNTTVIALTTLPNWIKRLVGAKVQVNIYANRILSPACESVQSHARIQRGTGGLDHPPALKNHKKLGFLSNNCLDLLKNQNAIYPAFNAGPSSARHRNAITMVFRRLTNDCQLILVFGSSPPPPPIN